MLQDKKKHDYIAPIAELVDVEEPFATPDNIIICSNPADPDKPAEAKRSQEFYDDDIDYDDDDYDDSLW